MSPLTNLSSPQGSCGSIQKLAGLSFSRLVTHAGIHDASIHTGYSHLSPCDPSCVRESSDLLLPTDVRRLRLRLPDGTRQVPTAGPRVYSVWGWVAARRSSPSAAMRVGKACVAPVGSVGILTCTIQRYTHADRYQLQGVRIQVTRQACLRRTSLGLYIN